MDFLKTQYAQIRDLFLGMTPGSRVIAALLAAVLLVSLGWMVAGNMMPQEDGDTTLLLDGYRFNQTEMGSCEAAFAKANLSKHKWIGDGKLQVPTALTGNYSAAIMENNCIQNSGEIMGKTVGNFGVTDSGKMMDMKWQEAMQRELGKTFSEFEGIDKATVLIRERLDRDMKFYDKKRLLSVSVNIWPKKREQLGKITMAKITATVRGSLGIQDLNDIRISNALMDQVSKGTEEGMQGGAKTLQEAQYEEKTKWEESIRDTFPDIAGLLVTASVELSDVASHKEHEVIHGAKPTEITNRTQTTSSIYDGAPRGGRPGYVAQFNTPNVDPNQNFVSKGDHREEKTKSVDSNSALQGKEIEVERSPFTLKKVAASIRIPMSHIRKVWAEKSGKPAEDGTIPEPTATDLANTELTIIDQIKKTVGNLFSAVNSDPSITDFTKTVDVTAYYDSAPQVEEKVEQAGFLSWLGKEWQTISLIGLVVLGLGVLWSVTRPRSSEPIVIYEAPSVSSEAAGMKSEEEAEEDEQIEITRMLEPFSKSVRSLQQEVADLVVENPDAAASVIRQWIGNIALSDK